MKAEFPVRGGRPVRKPPTLKIIPSVARAFGSCFRLRNPFFQFCFDGVEIEARAALHRREFDEGLEFLAHYLLNEDEAPELVFEPVEILLCAVLRSVVGPANGSRRRLVM